MSGTRPRQGAAIALSFAVQAALIAGILALPARSSATASMSSSGTASLTTPVTVKIGVASAVVTYPTSGAPIQFVAPPGTRVTATVTLADRDSAPGLMFTLYGHTLAPDGENVSDGARTLLAVPSAASVPSQGTHTFTLDLGDIEPYSTMDIVMTVACIGGTSNSVIAEITT